MPTLELLAHPATAYGLLAAGILLCTFLFLTVKQDLRRNDVGHARAEMALETLLHEFRSELTTLRSAVKDAEAKAATLPQMSEPRPGMNVSRRSQVLRMHRRGERPEQIAAALSLPMNEVNLLVKLFSEPVARTSAEASPLNTAESRASQA